MQSGIFENSSRTVTKNSEFTYFLSGASASPAAGLQRKQTHKLFTYNHSCTFQANNSSHCSKLSVNRIKLLLTCLRSGHVSQPVGWGESVTIQLQQQQPRDARMNHGRMNSVLSPGDLVTLIETRSVFTRHQTTPNVRQQRAAAVKVKGQRSSQSRVSSGQRVVN